MITTEHIQHIYFIGICGTAMATTAAMLKDLGYEVSGSDEGVYPPMSDFLARKGIPAHNGFTAAHLTPRPDLVVVGNALSRGNSEIEHMLNAKMRYASLPETIKSFLLRDKTSIVVTGTHGKTTTTSMISWALHNAGLNPDFLIGGIAKNFQSSYGLGGGAHFVIEGDEYDSAFFDKGPKFLHYLPEVAVIGNLEFDHADIYPNLDAIKLQFSRLVNLIPERGYLAAGGDSAAALEASAKSFCCKETFGLGTGNDWIARDIEIKGDNLSFRAFYKGEFFLYVRLGIYGTYNVRNSLAAIAVLHHLGLGKDLIGAAMESFQGVLRRLQKIAEVDGISIYEDFAHHPTAVRETLQTLRETFHPKRLWAVYEPRSATSRRNVFQREFADALSYADCIALPPLYKPEKTPAGQRLDEEQLIRDLNQAGRTAWNLQNVECIIRKVCEEALAGDLIVLLSNGGFDNIYQRLPQALRNRRADGKA
jgi:UDP-N-acetylmuramate: L-alanyl-gamma-D-glutamyl-meso-diaminopimelate ligase